MAKKYTYNPVRKDYRTLVWDGTYNADGSKHRKTIRSTKSSADLERKVAAFKAEVENQSVKNFSSMTFYAYAVQWKNVSKAVREKNTKAMYDNVVEKHLAFLDCVLIGDIKHSHFQEAINNQLDHPRTCQQIKITFKQIIKSAVRDGLLPKSALSDICEDISLPKYNKPQKRPLTEIETFLIPLLDIDDRKRVFLNIIYYCGLRRGEALALTADDFDFDSKELTVNKSLIFDGETAEVKPYPKTDNGFRRVPMPDVMIENIRTYVESNQGNNRLINNASGGSITKSGYTKMWESINTAFNRAAGWEKGEKPIKLTAHIFRHNYCTQLCYKVPEISTKMIARLMGDTEKMVLDVYSHILEEREKPHTVIAEIFGEKKPNVANTLPKTPENPLK